MKLAGRYRITFAAAAAAWAVACAAAVRGPAQREEAQRVDATLSNGAHRSHVSDGALHKAFSCDRCHETGTSPAGPARPRVTLAGFDAALGQCSTVYCHGGFPGGNTVNAPRWAVGDGSPAACGSCHAVPPAGGAHAAHASASRYTFGFDCMACHQDPDFPTRHVNGAVDVGFAAPAGSYTAGTCANLYCHSNARGTLRAITWREPPLSCHSCHDDETTTAPQMSGRHAFHLRIGVLCADCHGSVVNRRKQIIDFARHVNGAADVQVLAGRYAANTCFPACHDQRSW